MLHDALDLSPTARSPSAGRRPRRRSVGPDEVGHGLPARRVRRGTDVCIIGVGKMLAAAIEAAELLEAEGVSATVWDPRVRQAARPEHARRRRRAPGRGHRRGRAARRRRRLRHGRRPRAAAATGARPAGRRCSACPAATSPTASPTPSSPTSASTPPASPPTVRALR